MSQHGESSVEDILESIKKVIARDARTHSGNRTDTHGNTGMMDHDDADERANVPEPASHDEAEEVLDLGSDAIMQEDADHGFAGAVDDPDDSEPLVNPAARNSMRDNLAALAMIAEPGVPPQIVRSGETSLEGLAREMLRPMLSEWLDNHLPGMVETLVKAEIARIAGKRN